MKHRSLVLVVLALITARPVFAATVTTGTDGTAASAGPADMDPTTDKTKCSQSAAGPRVNLPGSGNPDGGVPFDPCATVSLASTDIGTKTPTGNAIPVAIDGGTLDPGWMPTDTAYGSGAQYKAAIWSAPARLKAAVSMMEDAVTGSVGIGTGLGAILAPLTVGNAETSSTNPQVLVSTSVDDTGSGNNHAFVDGSVINRSGGVAYAGFDAMAEFDGSHSYDHYVSYQARGYYNSSGTIGKMYGLYDGPTVTSLGSATDRFGVYIADVGGSGALTNNYGLYVASLRGTNKWGVYTAGTTPSYFGGALGVGMTAPTAPIHSIAASTSDAALAQKWSYNVVAAENYHLRLRTSVGSAIVRWVFDMVNNGTTYADTLSLDRGTVGMGVAGDLASRLTVVGIGNGGVAIRNSSSTNDRLRLFVGDGTGGYSSDEDYIVSTNTPLHMMTGPYGTVPIADFSSSAVAARVPLELHGATSGALTMQMPATVTPYALTWPAATGNGFLKNTGGTLSFASVGIGDLGLSLTSGHLPYYNGSTLTDSPLLSNGTQLLFGCAAYRASTGFELCQNGAALIQRSETAAGYASARWLNDQNSTTRSLEAGYTGSTFASGEYGWTGTTGNYPYKLFQYNASRLVLNAADARFVTAGYGLGLGYTTETTGSLPSQLTVTTATTNPGVMLELDARTDGASRSIGIGFGLNANSYPGQYRKSALFFTSGSAGGQYGYNIGSLCFALNSVADASNATAADCLLRTNYDGVTTLGRAGAVTGKLDFAGSTSGTARLATDATAANLLVGTATDTVGLLPGSAPGTATHSLGSGAYPWYFVHAAALKLYGSSSGSFSLQPQATAGAVQLYAPTSVAAGWMHSDVSGNLSFTTPTAEEVGATVASDFGSHWSAGPASYVETSTAGTEVTVFDYSITVSANRYATVAASVPVEIISAIAGFTCTLRLYVDSSQVGYDIPLKPYPSDWSGAIPSSMTFPMSIVGRASLTSGAARHVYVKMVASHSSPLCHVAANSAMMTISVLPN